MNNTSENNYYAWHVGFAFLPHIVEGGGWVWLKKIEYRVSPYSPMGLSHDYRRHEVKK